MTDSPDTPEARIKALEEEIAQLRESNRILQRETDSLRLVTAGLITSYEPAEVLNHILVSLESVVPYDSACIFLVEGDQQRVAAGRGFPNEDQFVGHVFPMNDPVTQELWQHRRSLVVEDARTLPSFEVWGGVDYIRGWMAVPMFLRDQAIGYLTVDSREVGTYSYEDAQLVQAFANQAAATIEIARLIETEHRQRALAETLQQVGSVIASSLDLDEVLQNIGQQVLRSMGAQACNIMLVQPPNMLVRRVCLGLADVAETWPSFERNMIGHGLSGWVAAHRKPLAVYDMSTDQRTTSPATVRARGLYSFLGVPLEVRHDLIGVLNIYTTQPRHFLDEEVKLLAAFAGQVAVAVENARLFEQVQQQAELLEARIMTRTAELVSANEHLRQEVAERQRVEEELHAFARRLERRAAGQLIIAETAGVMLATLDIDQLWPLVAETACQALGADRFAAYVFDAAQNRLSCAYARGLSDHYVAELNRRFLESPGHQVLTRQRLLVIENAETDPLVTPIRELVRAEGFSSYVVFPLTAPDQALGTLVVYYDDVTSPSADALTAGQTLAHITAVAMQNSRLYSELTARAAELVLAISGDRSDR